LNKIARLVCKQAGYRSLELALAIAHELTSRPIKSSFAIRTTAGKE